MPDRNAPTYSISLTTEAKRVLRKLDAPVQLRIEKVIDRLRGNPRPPGAKALQGVARLLRVRVGDYRILYTVEDQVLTVVVIAIGHRRDVYR